MCLRFAFITGFVFIVILSAGCVDMEKTPPPRDYPVERLTGKFDPVSHTEFVKIPAEYASRADMYMHYEAFEAFRAMYYFAQSEWIRLVIVSATRDFSHQKAIWEWKWHTERHRFPDPVSRARFILRYSSMPGTSRHHWGTDIDLNSLKNSYFTSGEGRRVYRWLCENANRFGYYQVYTEKSDTRPTGYEKENWHWSYIPIAGEMLKSYVEKVGLDDLSGFRGANTARELNIIKDYVQGITEIE
jgi:hypothetical protein